MNENKSLVYENENKSLIMLKNYIDTTTSYQDPGTGTMLVSTCKIFHRSLRKTLE